MTKRAFGELEGAILHLLSINGRMTVKEMQAALKNDDKYTTVMTVMLRMADKGLLQRERQGAQFEYWINPSQAKKPSLLAQIKQKMFGIKPVEIVSYLIEKEDELSLDELHEMEKLIKAAKKKREVKG